MMSPFWKPTLPAMESSGISVMTTPCVSESRCSSSATAGEIFATLAPWNGARAFTGIWSWPPAGAVSSGMLSFTGLPARCTSICAVPPSGRGAKRYSKPLGSSIDWPATAGIRSLAFRPARAAGAPRHHTCNERPGRRTKAEALGDLRRHRLQLGAEPRPLHRLAAHLGRSHDHAHHVGQNGKADALRNAGARIARGVDAGEPPGHVDQRAAGIAGVDRGIGLDEELVVGDADLRARQGRDDAVRHRLADAEGIADRDHDVTDHQL